MTGNGTDSRRKETTYLPLVGEVDGRTMPARAFKSAVADIVSDLGGFDHLTRAELEIVRRAAGLSVLAAQHETGILAGESVDVEKYVSTINAQRRLLVTLGLERRSRDVTPSLGEYLAARSNGHDAAPEAAGEVLQPATPASTPPSRTV